MNIPRITGALLLTLVCTLPAYADSAQDQRVKALTAQCDSPEAKVKGSQAEKDCLEGMRLMLQQIEQIGQEVQQTLNQSGSVQDARLVRQLDALSLKYGPSNSGGARMTMDRGNGRTQLVFVESKTYQLQDDATREFREVWSLAASQTQPFSEAQVRDLLKRNSDYIVGAWSIHEKDNGEYWAVFTAPIPAESSNAILMGAIINVTIATDTVEAALTGNKDDY